ncbi:MAG: 2-oxoacid:acceptor oxidoreductase subunit alpha [Bacteroidota bacterium]
MSSNKVTSTEVEKVVIKFAGDSGDGMQLTGTQFTGTSALLGNDLATFPDYPAEIRAPQGTVAGVSGFQVHIGGTDIHTPGDYADVLVAMNAAALKANLKWIKSSKTIIVDTDSFKKKDLQKAGWESNPLEDSTLDAYKVIKAPITSMTKEALKDLGLDAKTMARSKNMFTLGMVYWMFSRPCEHTIKFLNDKFGKKLPLVAEANIKALRAGRNYASTIEAIPNQITITGSQSLEKGTYKNVMGNAATAWGILAASAKSGRDVFLGSYPITPATEILQEIAKHKHFGAKAFQAEDEIAGIASTIGASFAGSLPVTTTSGPGLALKGEALGLAVMTELPLVVVNVQRGGPSTGLPTKTEQSDLMQALYGRNGESPVAVIAASSPADCFDYSFEASKIALEHMTPVVLLTDGYLGNGSAPWKITKMDELPDINPPIVKEGTENWEPYSRDAERLARTWALPGTPGLEHRIGGLEKDGKTGNVSYVPENHQSMTEAREAKIEKIADYLPELQVEGAQEGDLLVIGWGGTKGSMLTSVREMVGEGKSIGLAHFNYINPLQKNVKEILGRYKKIVVAELNLGQFANYLRMSFPEFEYKQYNKVQGLPFTTIELKDAFNKILNEN